MAITIDREHRAAMYQEVTLDLNGLTDLWTEFDDGNYERAKELRSGSSSTCGCSTISAGSPTRRIATSSS